MVKDRIHIDIEMEQQMSSRTKKSGQEYYELKLQLRLEYYDDIEKAKSFFYNLVISKFEGINDIHEKKNGFDFYFRSVGELAKISRYFSQRYFCDEKRSKKIIGRDHLKSKDMWRHTLLINILDLRKGDIVSIKGEEYYIKAFMKKDLVLIHTKSGSKKVISYNIAKDYFQFVSRNQVDKN